MHSRSLPSVQSFDVCRRSCTPCVRIRPRRDAGEPVIPHQATTFVPHVRALLAASALVALCACATRPPPDVRGHWSAVNRYSDTPQAIALAPPIAYYATPLDGTLKGLLARWARDAHRTLVFDSPYDYTLHRPVADVRSNDLQAAIARLASLYAAEHLDIAVEADRIVVRAAASAAAAQPSTPAAPAR